MIYILEDDESIRKLVIYALETQGFEAAGFENAEKFWMAYHEKKPELVLLDIMLPGEDGLSVLKGIRKDDTRIPVIMLTAKSTEYDKVTGLDQGADDYVSKPFGIMELISRIRAVLRRSAQDPAPDAVEYECGSLKILWDKREVYVEDELIPLTYKEYELLRLFIENSGHVLGRETLLQKVWGIDSERESRTLDVHIRTLRSKLKDACEMIQTVRGVGYKFIGEDK
ncbi:MAG: response regulator transcription factor [Lachnospiraceae bacterium]|nr:response regulator transcription factor [Lachnospiraceae bacterium]MBP1584594.1 response regulator transcription factor [Lachnospiraceae bacterium]